MDPNVVSFFDQIVNSLAFDYHCHCLIIYAIYRVDGSLSFVQLIMHNCGLNSEDK